MVLFVIAASYDLCTTLRAIFVVVSLVHKHTVNAQFFKGYNVVLAGLVVQLFELLFDRFLGALQLLD